MTIDRLIAAAALLLAAVYLFATGHIPSLEIGDPLGPKAFPRLLGIALIAAAILLIVETLKAPKEAREKPPSGSSRHLWVIGAVVVWTALYFAVFDVVGYLVATTIYLLVLTEAFNRGKRVANVLTSVLFALGSYILFVGILGVALAKGVPPVDAVSTGVDAGWKYAVAAFKSLFAR